MDTMEERRQPTIKGLQLTKNADDIHIDVSGYRPSEYRNSLDEVRFVVDTEEHWPVPPEIEFCSFM